MICRQVLIAVSDYRNALINIICQNWSAKIAGAIEFEKRGQICSCCILSVLTLYKNCYIDGKTLVNHVIIK